MTNLQLLNLKENDLILLKNGHRATILHVYEPGKTFMIDEIKDDNYPDKKEPNKITADEISDQIIRKHDLRVCGLMQTAKFLKDNNITCAVRHSDIVKMMKGDDEGNELLKKIKNSIKNQ